MRVFVAGAAGAIGRPLVRLLGEAGHEVVGTTRSAERAELIRQAGARPVIIDARDTEALRAAVAEAEPEAVINQLTSYTGGIDYRKPETFAATNELRGTVAPVLAGAAAAAGVRRLISQSVCFFYAPTDRDLHVEDDPLIEPAADRPDAAPFIALEALERSTLETPGLQGTVLRYGFFYGPGTWYAPGGAYWTAVRRRRFPVVGRGTGRFSYVHVDDAAGATVAALSGPPGIYNICDDEPAAMSDWVPAYAEAIGAKPPRRVPAWLVRLLAGRRMAEMATELKGASNERAKRELGWQPRYATWRQGFREALGES